MAAYPSAPNLRQFKKPFPMKLTQQGGNTPAAPHAALAARQGTARVRGPWQPHWQPPGQQWQPGQHPGPAHQVPFGDSRNGGGNKGGSFPGGRPVAPPVRDFPITTMPVHPPKPPVDPNSLLGVAGDGRNPLAHLQWWQGQGWDYNKNKNAFTQQKEMPQPGGPGGNPPGPGTGPPNNGQPGPPGDPNDPNNWTLEQLRAAGLPPDEIFRLQQQNYGGQLTQELARLSAARGQAQGYDQLATARMGTEHGQDTKQLVGNEAARGLYGSGIQRRDTRLLDSNYDRRAQDQAFGLADTLSQISQGELGAQGSFQQGILGALMDLKNRYATDPNAPISTEGTIKPPPPRKNPPPKKKKKGK